MKKDLYLSFVVLFQMIVTTIQLLLPLSGIANPEVASRYRIIITILTYLPGIWIVLLRTKITILIVFVAYTLFLLYNYALFPATHIFVESVQAYTLTPISLLTLLFILNIRDISAFNKMLKIISRLSVVISVVYVVANALSPFRDINDTYSMSFGYSMLLPAMFLFSLKGYMDKLTSLLIFVLILIDGSRGPIVVLSLYYIFDIFLLTSSSAKIRLIIVFAIASMISFVVLPQIDSFQESRTMRLFNSGELVTHDSGRDEKIYSIVGPHIWERPITGWGVGGDRFFLDGGYSHNVFIEIFIHYGVIIGSFIFILFFMWTARIFFSKNLKMVSSRKMLLMMFLYGFIPLVVSGSYLIDFGFSVMMGYFLKIFNNMKRYRRMSTCRCEFS